MALNAAFLAHRFPKLHQYTVQECASLSVHDFVNAGLFPTAYRKRLPRVKIIMRQAGCLRRPYIECPRCGRACEHLFQLPNGRKYACRLCNSLIYAVQRFGKRHLLRRIPSPRKRISQLRRSQWSIYPEWYPVDTRELQSYIHRKIASLLRPDLNINPDSDLPAWKRKAIAGTET